MCDKSHLTTNTGRFDWKLVEIYRGPVSVETAPVTTETTGTANKYDRFQKGDEPRPKA